MGNDFPSSGQTYMHIILNKWEEIMLLGEDFRHRYLLSSVDQTVTYKYVAKLTRLWGELYPKIQDRKDMGDLVPEFEKFSCYYFDPKQLASEEKAEDIFKLEMIIRTALEKLGITRYEP